MCRRAREPIVRGDAKKQLGCGRAKGGIFKAAVAFRDDRLRCSKKLGPLQTRAIKLCNHPASEQISASSNRERVIGGALVGLLRQRNLKTSPVFSMAMASQRVPHWLSHFASTR